MRHDKCDGEAIEPKDPAVADNHRRLLPTGGNNAWIRLAKAFSLNGFPHELVHNLLPDHLGG